MHSTQVAATTRLESLDWESKNFGFPVARVDARSLSMECLWAELDTARCAGVRLVVATDTKDSISQELLREFSGTLTDRKVTFSRTLPPTNEAGGHQATQSESVILYDQSDVSPELLHLAVSAGVYSRFAVDPRFPREKFEQMYRIWIERSVRRELADVVFVATNSGALDGFITVALRHAIGQIGLIAVAEHARGRGLGRQLIGRAHRWLQSHGASEVRVVTQSANLPACNLYKSCEYALATVEHYYHFWPVAERN